MKVPLSLVLATLATCACSAAKPVATPTRPKTVLIVRHAEKPDDGRDLNEAGRRRADALLELFEKSADRSDPFPAPDFLFAAKASNKSNRAVETLEPLGRAMNLAINDRIKNEDFAALATELLTDRKYEGKTVLVSWHHGKIPELIRALGVAPKPRSIGDGVFDRVWVVTYDAASKPKLTARPQALLPTDPKE